MNVAHGMILIGFLLICFAHQEILNHNDLRLRVQRFYATMISKKIFAWFVVTLMFIMERYIDHQDYQKDWVIEYLTFTATVFAIDVAQKHLGIRGKNQGGNS